MDLANAVALFVTPLALCAVACASPPPARAPQPWRPPSAAGATVPRAGDEIASRTLQWEVAVPRARYVREFLATDLRVFLPGTKKLPGVRRTEAVTTALYPAVGSVRRVVLADGNSAEEEVLEQDERHLKYLVARYTSPQAAPIAYGVGEFVFDDAGPAATRITWTYSFKLLDDRFPGTWGALGRTFFRIGFLNGDYADFMSTGREAMRSWAERLASTPGS